MRIFRNPLFIFAFWAGVAPCAAHALTTASVGEAKKAIQAGAAVVDVRPGKDYEAFHMPGAINIPFAEMVDASYSLYPPPDLSAFLSGMGLGRKGVTLVYGGRGDIYASFMGWVLEYLGSEDVRVFVGGVEEWVKAGEKLSREKAKLPPAEFSEEVKDGIRADAAYISKHIPAGGITLLDARSQWEYLGQEIRAMRGGHIPGAKNVEYLNALDPATKDLLPEKTLQARFAEIPGDRPVVVYCQTGAKAAMLFLALKQAGFRDVRLYPESWKEWGNTPNLPADDRTFFDFQTVTTGIDGLTARVNSLESEIMELSGKKEAPAASTVGILIAVCVAAFAGIVVGRIIGAKEKG